MEKVDGYIIIKNDDKSLSFDEISKYLEDCRKNNKRIALEKLIIKKFNLNKKHLTKEEIMNFIRPILEDNKIINMYFDNENDIYNDFYDSLCVSINQFPYSKILSNISKTLTVFGRSLTKLASYSNESFNNEEFVNSLKKITKTLLSYQTAYNDTKSIKDNLEKVIKYGWVVTFEIEDYILFNRITNKQKTNQAIYKLYNKSKIGKLEKEIIQYLKFDKYLLKYFNEAKTDFINKSYYSCAAMLFAIIDRLISMNFENKKTGVKGVEELDKILVNKEYYNGHLTYSTMNVLINIFSNANNFTLRPYIFNRNMLDHGWMKRYIYPHECLQLLLILKNLLYILNKETDIMPKTLNTITKKQ